MLDECERPYEDHFLDMVEGVGWGRGTFCILCEIYVCIKVSLPVYTNIGAERRSCGGKRGLYTSPGQATFSNKYRLYAGRL